MPNGSEHYMEFESPEQRKEAARRIGVYASRGNGSMAYKSINGFDSNNKPVFLLRATVVKTIAK